MNRHQIQTQEQAVNHFGRIIAARLTESSDQLPYDISERLRAARIQAVDRRKQVLLQAANLEVSMNRGAGMLTAGHDHAHASWWNRLGSIGLLLLLALGLLIINEVQDELGARELADIDAAILTDDLPPAAYIDTGFTQYLKSSSRLEP